MTLLVRYIDSNYLREKKNDIKLLNLQWSKKGTQTQGQFRMFMYTTYENSFAHNRFRIFSIIAFSTFYGKKVD